MNEVKYMPNLLECGRIINTHGIRGEVKIDPWCDSPDLFEQLEQLYIDGRPLPLEQCRPHKGFVLCKLAGVDSPEAAMALKNKTVYLDRDQVELADGAYFLADILGFEAHDTRTGQVLGTLREVRPSPASDLYIITGPLGEILIPAVPALVEKVDFAQRRILFNTIKGMLPNED